ncbi:MAG: hypothetical protein WCT28_04090 [Patescibacteria group bacterium]|jgi:hypothetical protein
MQSSPCPVILGLENLKALVAAKTDTCIGPEYLTDALIHINKPDNGNRISFVEGIETIEATEELLVSLEWEEASKSRLPDGLGDDPSLRYFLGILPVELVGRTDIVKFDSLTEEQREKGIGLSEGYKFGPQMFVSWDGPLPETREVWAIIGERDGTMVFYTWHLGPLVPRYNREVASWVMGMIHEEDLDTQVKRAINALGVKLNRS